MRTNKKYFVPSLLLIIVFIGKLYFADLLEPIYLALKGYPLYTGETGIQWWKMFGVIAMDMLVGIIYAWVKVRNSKEEEDNLEDRVTIEEEDEKEDEEVGIVERGFNYLWMGGVSTMIISILWSIVMVIVTSVIQPYVIMNPTISLTLFIVLTGMRVILSGIAKSGILAYVSHSEYRKSNVLQALKFTTKNIFRLVLVEIVYLLWVGVGILALGVGVFLTHPKAVEYKTEKWSKLVRDYEREELYGTINK